MSKSLLRNFFFVVSLLTTQLLSAVTYYVSPTGTGTGTIASPMAFSTAIGKSLTAGDSLILRGGTYSLSSKQGYTKSGSSVNYIHIVAYKGETPILDFRNETYGSSYPGVSLSGSYVHIKGLTIQGAGDNGMIVSGSYNFIENCTFRWNCDSGLQMKTGSNNYILNCDSYENFDYESSTIGGNADGFADKQYENTGLNKYKGCRSWRNSDDGWDHYEKIGNTQYDSCWCYANGPASYDMKNHIRFKTDSAAYFVKFASTNYVITNKGNGNGFKLGGNYTAHNATLHDCISVLNTVKGFDQNNDNGTMTIYNCTGYMNSPDYGFSNSSYGSLVIKNSATLASKSSNKFAAKTTTNINNSWSTGFSCTTSDFLSLDYTQMLNARQEDGSLPEITFLHLKSTSTMIDKGLDLGYSFAGTAPDLGAFEYGVNTAVENVKYNSKLQYAYNRSERSITILQQVNKVKVIDITGKVMTDFNTSDYNCRLNTSNWTQGIYIITVITTDGILISDKVYVY